VPQRTDVEPADPGRLVVTSDDEAAPDDVPADDQAPPDDARADDATAADAPAGAVPVDGARHDAAWFEAVVRECATPVHRYLVRRVGLDDAEDLAADVLLVAWRRRADVPDDAVLPWLYRTAGFVVANHRRKGRPVPVGELPDEPDDDDPAVRAVRDDRVRAVLASLSPRDRQVLLLTAWEGLTGDELAVVLGIGRGGADAALSRARTRLAAAWSADTP
jgi:RNA polymerase sigma-70 factor (ECF subfamily)